jgi:hypothetical protein
MKTPSNDGGVAFPVPDSYHANGMVQYGANGMTLRDYFAGQALTGAVQFGESPRQLADRCYQMADAMLAARERKEDAK